MWISCRIPFRWRSCFTHHVTKVMWKTGHHGWHNIDLATGRSIILWTNFQNLALTRTGEQQKLITGTQSETKLPLSLLKNGGKVLSEVWKSEWNDYLVILLALRSFDSKQGGKNRLEIEAFVACFSASDVDTKPKLLSFGDFWKLEGNATIGGSIIKRRMTQCTPCFKDAVKKRTHENVLQLFPGCSFSMSIKLKCN